MPKQAAQFLILTTLTKVIYSFNPDKNTAAQSYRAYSLSPSRDEKPRTYKNESRGAECIAALIEVQIPMPVECPHQYLPNTTRTSRLCPKKKRKKERIEETPGLVLKFSLRSWLDRCFLASRKIEEMIVMYCSTTDIFSPWRNLKRRWQIYSVQI
jgi:hypothetical protein